ncbi:MAG: tetratricopeptide repeat protein [Anaerolineales bacterium]
MQKQLEQAIALAQSGQRAAARDLLQEIIAQEPSNETAWLWLASLAITQDERIEALTSVLAINPANPQARSALQKLGFPLDDLPSRGAPAAVPMTTTTAKSQGLSTLEMGIIGAVAVLIALVLMLFATGLVGGDEPAPTDTPTPTVTPGPSLTPTLRVTATPSFTPGPSPTPVVNPTLPPEQEIIVPTAPPLPTRILAPTITPRATRTIPFTLTPTPTLTPTITLTPPDEPTPSPAPAEPPAGPDIRQGQPLPGVAP